MRTSLPSVKYIFCAFAVFFVLSANAADVKDGDIIKQIEKSLIFDGDARSKINFYNNDNSKKKSDFTLHRVGEEEQAVTSSLDILVTNPKVSNIDLREKERLAYSAILIDQWEVAIEIYKEILVAEPENNYVKLSLAVAYQKIEQFKQAKKLYYELLKQDSESRDLIIANLLNILIEESPRDTTYLLSRLVLQNPQSPTILASAAMAYDKVGNYENAVYLLEKAINLDSSRLDYQYNLSIIYDKMGRYEDALKF
jgi:tetratricopeptide (TPR) repeat protein